MKFLKRLGWFLLILSILLIAAVFLMPQDVHVEASKKIEAKPQTVFNIINDLKLEKTWSPWLAQDTTMVNTFGEITKGEGASYSWKSENMGDGSATITEVIKNEKIVQKLNFGGMGEGTGTFTLMPSEEGTELKWEMDSKTSKPWNLINFLIKRNTRSSFDLGLENLARIAEKRQNEGVYRGYQINEEMVDERKYITNRDIVPISKVGQFYAQSLGPLFKKIQEAKVEMSGHPSGLFYKMNLKDGTTDMAAGIPVAEEVNIKGTTSKILEANKALVVNFYGDYKKTIEAHNAVEEYINDRNLYYDWPVIEEYVTDPSEEPNPEKWLTRIIYYLSE